MSLVHIMFEGAAPCFMAKNDVTFWWDKQNCDAHEYSIGEFVKKNFLSLRQEFIEFIDELGEGSIKGRALSDWFNAGDRLSMWWCSLLFEKHPMLMPEVYNILKLRALERMLADIAPNCKGIVLHGGDVELKEIIAKLCANSRMQFNYIEQADGNEKLELKDFFLKIYNKLPYPLRAVLRFVHWFITVRLFLPYTKDTSPSKSSATMVSYFENTHNNGEFYSPYWEPLQRELLERKKNLNWLFIRINSPHWSLKQMLANIKFFKQKYAGEQSFHFAEEFLKNTSIFSALIRYARLTCVSYKLEKAISNRCKLGENLDIWPLIARPWRESFRGWICLERSLQRESMLGYAAWAKGQEFVLFPLENCPWERMLTESMQNISLVYGAQHSVVRPTDLRYFDSPRLFENHKCLDFIPHKILVNGKNAYELMLEAGVPAPKLLEVEALRYLHLVKGANVENVKKQSKNSILIVTSFFEKSVDEHIALLASFIAAEKKSGKEWHVNIKAHPYCAVENAIIKHMPRVKRVTFSNKNMPELLADASKQGTIVWAANDTSVIVEALYMNLKVLVQGEGAGLDLCPVQGLDGLEYVCTYEDIKKALATMQNARIADDYYNLNSELTQYFKLLKLR